MCQISVLIEREGELEKVMDNVTRLEVLENGVRLSTFFEEPKNIQKVMISSIDFLGGKVVLNETNDINGTKKGSNINE